MDRSAAKPSDLEVRYVRETQGVEAAKCLVGGEATVATTLHKWRKAPRSLFSRFMCSVCGATSMVKHYGRCSGGR